MGGGREEGGEGGRRGGRRRRAREGRPEGGSRRGLERSGGRGWRRERRGRKWRRGRRGRGEREGNRSDPQESCKQSFCSRGLFIVARPRGSAQPHLRGIRRGRPDLTLNERSRSSLFSGCGCGSASAPRRHALTARYVVLTSPTHVTRRGARNVVILAQSLDMTSSFRYIF